MIAAEPASTRPGQPLVALIALIGCWVCMRVAMLGLPSGAVPAPPPPRLAESSRPAPPVAGERPDPGGTEVDATASVLPPAFDIAPPVPVTLMPRAPVLAAVPVAPPAGTRRIETAAGHNLLWMAAMSALPLPEAVAAALRTGPAPAPQVATPPLAGSRWSGDAWIVLRGGGSRFGAPGPAAPGPAAPVYGGSQAGAVLRYRLAPGSAAQPSAYVRAAGALGRTREADLAAGLSVRPVAALPVTAAGEVRMSLRDGSSEIRPAAFLAAGFDNAHLPAGMRARGYAQAGYVAGNEATAFADGSIVGERPLARTRAGDLDAGGGIWGGVQRGAGRLDIGPSASLRIRLGETGARLAADYRVRVAGNADPASSAALTLSAGF